MKHSCLLMLFLTCFFLTSCHSDPDPHKSNSKTGTITVHNTWARPAKQGMMGGAYLTIANGTNRPDTVVSITTDVAETAEIHESYQQRRVSGMRPAEKLTVDPHSTLELKPGGYHIMLMQLNRELVPGDTVEATLYFAEHDSIQFRIPVQMDEN